MDDELQNVHHRLIQALGSLGKGWSDIQDFVTGNSEEESLEPEKVVTNLNSAVALLCQAIHKLSYERRLAALTVSSDLKTARRQVKDHTTEITNEEHYLFGEEFQKNLKNDMKAQESAEKLFGGKKKRGSSSTNRPFSHRPSGTYYNNHAT